MKDTPKKISEIQLKPVVQIKNISKLFGKHNWAVKNVSFPIYPKECISLLGSNGSGKTTLISLIANSIKPTLGEITYSFEESDLNQIIGFQNQHQDWPAGFLVKDITAIWISAYEVIDQEWVIYLKEVFGINQIWNKYLAKQSIVTKQLFALFLVFLYKPRLVLIDQLSSDIDWKNSEKISKLLIDYIKAGNTVVLNSPSPYFLERLSTRVIYISGGEIIDDLSKTKIKREYKTMMNYSKALVKEETIKERSSNNKRKVFSPIVTKLNNYIVQLQDAIKGYVNYKHLELSKLDEETINTVFAVASLKEVIAEFYKQEINKQSIKNVIKLIKETRKYLFKTRKHIKAWNPRLSSRITKILKTIIKYLEGDLIAIFANEKTLYQQSDEQNILSLKERQQLKRLKRKYIKEEIRHLKTIARREKLKQTLRLKRMKSKQ
ncbi:ATP-binding cassette domain-containing protein [Mesoplasma seiffertii]|uniref:ATP-binding cassette domain-containing protein n=1 Tax=Mesoplasma seiffertii TaxID=28224 RepID=UPI000479AE05|nr:ATP-binding cassette domain-containing protein [Mesoplasma seiffertii]